MGEISAELFNGCCVAPEQSLGALIQTSRLPQAGTVC
jgi:hypothetical protein